jgi:MFS family permease
MKKYIAIGSNELDTYLDYALFSAVSIFMLNASPKEIGVLGACYALPFFFLSKILGKWSDSVSVRKFRAVIFFLCIAITPGILFAHSMWLVYLVLLAKISCRCALGVSMPKLNTDAKESKRFYEIVGYLVNASRVIIPITSVIIYRELGLIFVVMLSSALNLSGLIFTVIDKEYGCAERRPNSDSATHQDSDLLKRGDLLVLISAYIMSSISFYLSNDMVALFFQRLGESVDSIGYIITALGIGGIIGTKLSSALLSTFTPIVVYSGSIIVNAISFCSFGFTNMESTPVNLYYSLVLLTGIASGISFVAVKYGVRKAVDFEKISTVTGLIQKMSSIVAVLLPVLGGIVADAFGIQSPFIITGVLLSMILVYTLTRARSPV